MSKNIYFPIITKYGKGDSDDWELYCDLSDYQYRKLRTAAKENESFSQAESVSKLYDAIYEEAVRVATEEFIESDIEAVQELLEPGESVEHWRIDSVYDIIVQFPECLQKLYTPPKKEETYKDTEKFQSLSSGEEYSKDIIRQEDPNAYFHIRVLVAYRYAGILRYIDARWSKNTPWTLFIEDKPNPKWGCNAYFHFPAQQEFFRFRERMVDAVDTVLSIIDSESLLAPEEIDTLRQYWNTENAWIYKDGERPEIYKKYMESVCQWYYSSRDCKKILCSPIK